jgi:hypothetical protein
MESIRRTLVWRLHNLLPLPPVPPPSTLHLLPESQDSYGRPIIILNNFASVEESPTERDFRKILPQTIERLRLYLKALNDSDDDREAVDGVSRPILQYVVLLDLEGVAIQNIVWLSLIHVFWYPQSDSMRFQNVELVTWIIREVIPRFPGMLAAGMRLPFFSATVFDFGPVPS